MSDRERTTLTPTSWLLLASLLVVTAVTAFVLGDLWLRSGHAPFVFPFGLFIVPVVVGVATLWVGWAVRAYRRGKRAIDQLHAARVWLLSEAVSRAGSIFAGLSGGVALAYANTSTGAVMGEQILHLSLAGGGALFMTLAGWIVERWCTNDDDPSAEGSASA